MEESNRNWKWIEWGHSYLKMPYSPPPVDCTDCCLLLLLWAIRYFLLFRILVVWCISKRSNCCCYEAHASEEQEGGTTLELTAKRTCFWEEQQNMMNNGQNQTSYMQINPKGEVPANEWRGKADGSDITYAADSTCVPDSFVPIIHWRLSTSKQSSHYSL